MAEAIILRSGSLLSGASKKVILFDQQLGKIDVLMARDVKKNHLVYGGLINYSLQEWNNMLFMSDIQLLSVPGVKDSDDILFVHHWLELADLFCAYHEPNEQAYSSLLQLYKLDKYSSVFKRKIMLIQFLTVLGVYPENEGFVRDDFLNLILTPGDTMLSNDDETQDTHTYVDEWLWECLASHPKKPLIKTMAFLKR